jgi:hypothetical protein
MDENRIGKKTPNRYSVWLKPGTLGSSLQSKRPALLFLSILLGLVLSACQPVRPSRWEDAQPTTEAQLVVSDGDVIKGSEFNQFFPEASDPFNVVFLQEKEGFAEAKLEYEGDEVATLAISDTANNPSARDKYGQSTKRLAGYPLVAVGSNGTAILVADRFQVQVRSKAEDFAAEDRESWLQEFDLKGLADLAD